MGDDTKRTELDKGNTKPLEGPLKPSTAEGIDVESPEMSRVPQNEAELPRNDADDRERTPTDGTPTDGTSAERT